MQLHIRLVRAEFFDAVVSNCNVLPLDADSTGLDGLGNLNRVDRPKDLSTFAGFRADFDGEGFEFGL